MKRKLLWLYTLLFYPFSFFQYLKFRLRKKSIDKNYLVSIILLSYNHSNLTKQCLKSIFKNSNLDHIEIILIENGSNNRTKKEISIFKKYSCIKYIDLKKNIGFIRANNLGIKKAKGNYIVLLNNDTIVTKNWLDRLIFHVKKESVGLVGPVTNNIGNEARIHIKYSLRKKDDLEKKAKLYCIFHWNKTIELNSLASFCWIMRKEVQKKVGYFDTHFETGFFDDDDYCMRVKKEGLKILCAEDVFIHHYGGKTLNRKNNRYERLFQINKRKFENKWKIKWVPHKYRNYFFE